MGLKFDLIKYLNTNFSNSGSQIFLKISGIVGVDTLSTYKVIGSFDLTENFRVKFSKIWLGGPSSQGYQIFKKCYGGSIGGLETYLTVKKSYLYDEHNSTQMALKFDQIKYLNPNFSNSGRQNFPKFSGNVDG